MRYRMRIILANKNEISVGKKDKRGFIWFGEMFHSFSLVFVSILDHKYFVVLFANLDFKETSVNITDSF